LSTHQSKPGLIAIGLPQNQWQALSRQKQLLTLFAIEATEMPRRQQNMLSHQQKIIEDGRANFHLETRTVVHEANNHSQSLTIICTFSA
jgi:hypothetical protein